jgi:hypothetical protein
MQRLQLLLLLPPPPPPLLLLLLLPAFLLPRTAHSAVQLFSCTFHECMAGGPHLQRRLAVLVDEVPNRQHAVHLGGEVDARSRWAPGAARNVGRGIPSCAAAAGVGQV